MPRTTTFSNDEILIFMALLDELGNQGIYTITSFHLLINSSIYMLKSYANVLEKITEQQKYFRHDLKQKCNRKSELIAVKSQQIDPNYQLRRLQMSF